MAIDGGAQASEPGPAPRAISDREIAEMLADRERHLAEMALEALEGARPEAVSVLSADEARALVSDAAYDLIVRYETGGRSYYERVYKSRPCWPGYMSGVTIGFGFDLRFHSRAELEAAWGKLLTDSAIERLSEAIGKGGAVAQDMAAGLDDIQIPWGLAETAFRRHTLPKYVGQTVAALANVRTLHPHASGALVSLVFNRGADFKSPADKRREMRAIRAAMAEARYGRVPDELRAMQRLWPSPGLKSRRREEAALFARGLESATLVVAPVPRPDPVPQPAPVPPPPAPVDGAAPDPMPPLLPDLMERRSIERQEMVHRESVAVAAARSARAAPQLAPRVRLEEDWLAFDRRPAAEIEGAASDAVTGRYRPRLDDVRWPAEDWASPDYRHIAGLSPPGDPGFTLTADDLDLLIAANRFDAARGAGPLLFGLRGARLAAGTAVIDAAAVPLVVTRPDHRTLACVLGVLDPATRRLSVFPGSTVPNRAAVLAGWQHARAGDPPEGHLLPTGCYGLVVGAHRTGPGAFLLRDVHDRRRTLAVLRTTDDVVYAIDDALVAAEPDAGIMPARSATTSAFSSFGAQTIAGDCTAGTHSGDWALFRRAAGLTAHGVAGQGAAGRGEADDGRVFAYVLLTGEEARSAAHLRARDEVMDAPLLRQRLVRLRQGAQGDEVARLQAALGLPQTRRLGVREVLALAAWQGRTLGVADGIYAPDHDAYFGRPILGPAPALETGAESTRVRAGTSPLAHRSAPLRSAQSGSRAAVASRGPMFGALAGRDATDQICALLAEPEGALVTRLGLLTQEVRRDPRKAGQLDLVAATPTAAQESMSDALTEIGERVYARLEPELFRLVCGTGRDDAHDRDAIKKAIQQSGGGADGARGPIVVAVAGALMGTGAVWYGAALVVGAIFARRIAQATMEETCQVWGAKRRTRRAGSEA